MELRELRYFVQIAQDQSYTKAANRLFISQPALSKTMKKLEYELGVPLLVVKSNGVFLSDFGQALYERTIPLLNEFDALSDFVQEVKTAKMPSSVWASPPCLPTFF